MQIASDQVALYLALYVQHAQFVMHRVAYMVSFTGLAGVRHKVVSRLMTDCNARIEIVTLIPRRYFTQ